MKFYKFKDKDPYVYNDSLFDKQKRKRRKKDFLIRLQSALLAFQIALVGTISCWGISYSFKKSNPFDGQSITSSDFSTNYRAEKSKSFLEEEGFKDILESIKNSGMEEKKAYLLYYALLSNDYLTNEEKEKLTGYIQYFIDNKYLDYEYVYSKLALLTINQNFESLYEFGAAGIYNQVNNSMTFATDSDRDYALSHEILHAEDKSGDILSYHDYAWFIEGLTCVLNYEYLNNKSDGENIKAYFVRLLCELIDPDILFKVRATGNMNILIAELENKGVKKDTVLELFKLFNDYNYLKEEEKTINGYCNTIHETLKKEISIKLIEIYNSVYKNPDFMKPIYFDYILIIESEGYSSLNQLSEESSFYYFNSQKKGEFSKIIKFDNMTNYISYENLTKRCESHLYDESVMTSIKRVSQNDFTIKYNNLLKLLEEDKKKDNSKLK